MSHFTEIKTEIRSMEALKSACRKMDLEVLEPRDGKKPVARGYGSNEREGEAVIRLKGPYDVALIQNGESYSIVTDWWGGHVAKEIGDKAIKLFQEYGVAAATMEARKKGYTVRRQDEKDGSVKLVVGVMG